MEIKNKSVRKLLDKYKEISTLGKISAVLGWDLNVNLPPKGVEERANQSAYLAKLTVEKWMEPGFKNELETVTKKLKNLNTEELAIVRNLNQGARFYHKVPKEIIVEFEETSSKAYAAWAEARKNDKFKDFEPHLKKLVRLNQIIAEYYGFEKNPYDALLDLYEPGLTAEKVSKVFATLIPELTKLIKLIKGSKNYRERSDLVDAEVTYPADDQKQICMYVIKKMGYDMEAGHMGISPHPFTSELGRFDVRITNRYKPNDFRDSVAIAMHETGHALYEQGVKEEYAGTPLGGGVSLGIHESQSRFWENQVGRSFEFIKFLTPVFHAFYPEQLGKIDAEEIFSLFNMVHPSLIRTEADEVTYNLHIALRFELEEALINGKIKVENLPEIWRLKMKKYLGIMPKTNREGVLQDVHWSQGPMGYFPTYTLGNLYGAQFVNKMMKDLDLSESISKGELGIALSWLRENIHQYGSLYWPNELIKKVTGEELNPKYFLGYLKDKFARIYAL